MNVLCNPQGEGEGEGDGDPRPIPGLVLSGQLLLGTTAEARLPAYPSTHDTHTVAKLSGDQTDQPDQRDEPTPRWHPPPTNKLRQAPWRQLET